jgi:predicted  nucleic acid-binding Zn-ribbon protein
MSEVTQLIKRTEHLQTHLEALREELDRLRQDLDRMQHKRTTPIPQSHEQGTDCVAVALALAEDLGPHFASEDPHSLAERGEDWFRTP